jgi:hypothetical protein
MPLAYRSGPPRASAEGRICSPGAQLSFLPPQPLHFFAKAAPFPQISTQCLPLAADKTTRGNPAAMIISLTVPDTVVRAAQDNNLSVEEFVDTLIDKGMEKATGRPMVVSAIERIRALRSDTLSPKA